MQPWNVPEIPDIPPIEHISPSRASGLLECSLRETWAIARTTMLLPVAPAARLGTALHALLEKGAKGRFNGLSGVQIRSELDALVVSQEREMAGSWLERFLVPISAHVADFEVRATLGCTKALKLASGAGGGGSRIFKPGLSAASEVYLRSCDGQIVGRVDEISLTSEGVVLRDYKTGNVLEEPGGKGAKVKMAYQMQLKIYAALYASQFGEWPIRLEVIPLQGQECRVVFNAAESLAIVEQISSIIKKINETISITGSKDLQRTLASPAPAACRFCKYRPGCIPYRTVAGWTKSEHWPADLVGFVEEKRVLGNGTVLLRLSRDKGGEIEANIRGLDARPSRHPALHEIANGDMVGVYNLRGNRGQLSFSEGPLTVIYKHN